MPATQLPITGGLYINRSKPISNQKCQNLYVHVNEGGGLANESLYGTPGSNLLATSGVNQEANRGSWEMNKIPYFVNGDTLFRLTRTVSAQGVESFSLDSLGTIAGSGRVSMANNETQLCIVVPGTISTAYIWNEGTSTFTEITGVTNFKANGEPQHVVYIDNFFLFTTDTKKFIISNLNNGLLYNALDFGSAEADPDEIVAPIVINNIPYIAGSKTFEPFRNAAAQTGAGFPFIRIDGGIINIGVFSAFSLVRASGTFFFIGGGKNEEPSVYQFSGANSFPVSNDGIDELLGELTEEQLSNVAGWSYSQNKQRFVGFILPTTTIVYNLTNKKWHERKSFDIVDGVATEFRHRVNSVVKAYGRILVGDSIDGRVGEMKLDIFTEYGQNIIRDVSTLPFSNVGGIIKVSRIELVMESGVGNADDPDPTIWMRRSLDGKTFTTARTRKIGKAGEFKKRQMWRRNGKAEQFELFRFTTSAKVKIVIIKLEGVLK